MFLGDEIKKVVLLNNEFIRKMNQESFRSDVAGFATSLDLKLDILISNLQKFN